MLILSIRQPKRNPHYAQLQQVLNDLQNDPSAWPFVKPVDASVVTDYYNVITSPMGEFTLSRQGSARGTFIPLPIRGSLAPPLPCTGDEWSRLSCTWPSRLHLILFTLC